MYAINLGVPSPGPVPYRGQPKTVSKMESLSSFLSGVIGHRSGPIEQKTCKAAITRLSSNEECLNLGCFLRGVLLLVSNQG
jgi:hypothetical protein